MSFIVPEKDETRLQFVDRFMLNKNMIIEYPNPDNRYDVANMIFNDAKEAYNKFSEVIQSTPNFQPGSIGEGKPSKNEYNYRKELLNILYTEFYLPVSKFWGDDKLSVATKEEKATKILETKTIPRLEQFAEYEVKRMFRSGVEAMNKKLRDAGAEHNAIVSDNPEQLQNLIIQQQKATTGYARILLIKLVNQLMIKQNKGFYAKD